MACRRLLRYSWNGQGVQGIRVNVDAVVPLDTADMRAEVRGNTMTMNVPWPFMDNGPLRQQFFMTHAWTSTGSHIINQTMTETVRL